MSHSLTLLTERLILASVGSCYYGMLVTILSLLVAAGMGTRTVAASRHLSSVSQTVPPPRRLRWETRQEGEGAQMHFTHLALRAVTDNHTVPPLSLSLSLKNEGVWCNSVLTATYVGALVTANLSGFWSLPGCITHPVSPQPVLKMSVGTKEDDDDIQERNGPSGLVVSWRSRVDGGGVRVCADRLLFTPKGEEELEREGEKRECEGEVTAELEGDSLHTHFTLHFTTSSEGPHIILSLTSNTSMDGRREMSFEFPAISVKADCEVTTKKLRNSEVWEACVEVNEISQKTLFKLMHWEENYSENYSEGSEESDAIVEAKNRSENDETKMKQENHLGEKCNEESGDSVNEVRIEEENCMGENYSEESEENNEVKANEANYDENSESEKNGEWSCDRDSENEEPRHNTWWTDSKFMEKSKNVPDFENSGRCASKKVRDGNLEGKETGITERDKSFNAGRTSERPKSEAPEVMDGKQMRSEGGARRDEERGRDEERRRDGKERRKMQEIRQKVISNIFNLESNMTTLGGGGGVEVHITQEADVTVCPQLAWKLRQVFHFSPNWSGWEYVVSRWGWGEMVVEGEWTASILNHYHKTFTFSFDQACPLPSMEVLVVFSEARKFVVSVKWPTLASAITATLTANTSYTYTLSVVERDGYSGGEVEVWRVAVDHFLNGGLALTWTRHHHRHHAIATAAITTITQMLDWEGACGPSLTSTSTTLRHLLHLLPNLSSQGILHQVLDSVQEAVKEAGMQSLWRAVVEELEDIRECKRNGSPSPATTITSDNTGGSSEDIVGSDGGRHHTFLRLTDAS